MILIFDYCGQYDHLLFNQTIDHVVPDIGTSASNEMLIHELEYLRGQGYILETNFLVNRLKKQKTYYKFPLHTPLDSLLSGTTVAVRSALLSSFVSFAELAG